MGFCYAFEIVEFALENVADSGEAVDAFSYENLGALTLFRKVFPEHQKVVAVVEVELPRRIVRKSSAANVVNFALRYAPDLMAHQRGSPAEINLFHVGEELLVQSAQPVPYITADNHTGSRCPEALYRAVILAFVFFYAGQDPAAAKRKAPAVYKASCGSCILELLYAFFVMTERKDLGLAGGGFFVGFHEIHQRF